MSFQIKGHDEKHKYTKEVKYDSLVNLTQIAKQYIKELNNKPNIKIIDMKEYIKQVYV